MTVTRKIWQILTPNQRRAAAMLMVLIFIGMGLETLGIGMVIPALALMAQGDPAVRYPSLAPRLNRLGNPSRKEVVVWGMLVLIGTAFSKAEFLTFLAWQQSRFVCRLQAELSQRLLALYLRQPHCFTCSGIRRS